MMSSIKASYLYPGLQSLEICQGDLTEERLDAIVNAANSHLAHSGGIAAAISSRGGEQIDQESQEWVHLHGQVSHEKPAYTGAGRLPCRYVIHAVGPVWGSGSEETKLAAAIRGSLNIAVQLKLTSIAFPAISTGIFGFPVNLAARVFYTTFWNYFNSNPSSPIRLTRLVLFDSHTLQAFLTGFNDWQQSKP